MRAGLIHDGIGWDEIGWVQLIHVFVQYVFVRPKAMAKAKASRRQVEGKLKLNDMIMTVIMIVMINAYSIHTIQRYLHIHTTPIK